jgi:hypothetical protein
MGYEDGKRVLESLANYGKSGCGIFLSTNLDFSAKKQWIKVCH